MEFVSDVELQNQYYASLVRAKHIGKIIDIQMPDLPLDVFFYLC